MCIIYDDGIHVWNVYTAFHDIGTYKHIIFFIHKIQDRFFQLITVHLPMCKGNTEIRAESLDECFHFCQAMYAVMNKKYLPAPFCFIINGIPYKVGIKNMHLGLYGLPVWRRCIDDAEIPRSHKAE